MYLHFLPKGMKSISINSTNWVLLRWKLAAEAAKIVVTVYDIIDHFWNFSFWNRNWHIVHTVRQTQSTKNYHFQYRPPFCSWKLQRFLHEENVEITRQHNILYTMKWCLGQLTKFFLCIFIYFLKHKLDTAGSEISHYPAGC